MDIDRHVYMASREWALKREAVRERSQGFCERCWYAPQEAVHHMTYEHLGDEPLDELLAVCRPCHAWLSAKSDFDPAAPLSADEFIEKWYALTTKKHSVFRSAGVREFMPDSERFPSIYQGDW